MYTSCVDLVYIASHRPEYAVHRIQLIVADTVLLFDRFVFMVQRIFPF